MEQLDSIKAFKYFTIIVLSFLFIGNAYLFFQNSGEEETFSLSEEEVLELRELLEENQRLRYLEDTDSLTAREERFVQLEGQAERFLTSIFEQDADTYQSKKAEAEEVMNEELFDRFFSAEMYGANEVQTRIEEANYYIENIADNENEIEVVMEVRHEIEYIKTEVMEESHAFMRVTFERQDEQWIATGFRDLT